jgi:hypothetical protein
MIIQFIRDEKLQLRTSADIIPPPATFLIQTVMIAPVSQAGLGAQFDEIRLETCRRRTVGAMGKFGGTMVWRHSASNP